jgi:hypothetical protein
MKSPSEEKIELYKIAEQAFIEMTGLKVGSEVRILRKAKNWEFGWNDTWVEGAMKDHGTFIVSSISVHGRGITDKINRYNYPFFVLEVISESLPKPIALNASESYFAEFNPDGSIEVGCQEISYETLKSIYDTATGVLYK